MGLVAQQSVQTNFKKLTLQYAAKIECKTTHMAAQKNSLLSVKPCVLFFNQTLLRLLCAGAIRSVIFLDLFGPVKPCALFYIQTLSRIVYRDTGAISRLIFLDFFGPVKPYALFYIQTLPRIVYRCYKPCDFFGFVWTDCGATYPIT